MGIRKDVSGTRFGILTAVEVDRIDGRKTFWKCLCDCGNYTTVLLGNLNSGAVKSCGCLKHKYKNLTGMAFGNLVAVEKTDERDLSGRVLWKCLCTSCGNHRTFVGSELLRGTYTHCGCSVDMRDRFVTRYLEDKLSHAIRNRLLNYKNNATVRGYDFNLTYEQFSDLVKSDCHYCGNPPSNKTVFNSKLFGEKVVLLNGVDRVDSTIGYEPDNVVPCCSSCNRAKNNMSKEVFFGLVNKIVSRADYDDSKTSLVVTKTEISKRFQSVWQTIKRKTSCQVELTRDFVRDIIQKPCHYCGKNDALGGIDRVDSSVGYVEHNCVPACKHCNMLKGVMTQSEFYNWVGRIVKLAEKSLDNPPTQA